MQNYSAVFAETLAEFESPIVPADQADAGKGQLLVRTGYKIWRAGNKNIGYIRKNPGQNQFMGVGVDVLKDNNDGSWADFITDVAVAGDPSKRLIKLVFVSNPPSGSPPYADWVEPNVTYFNPPGPMKLKSEPMPGPDPTPTPPTDNTEVLAKLDEIKQLIMDSTISVMANDNANTEKIQTQIHDLVEDVEDSLKQILPLITCRYQASSGVGGSLGGILGGLFSRTKERRKA